ncbi:arginyl-tRNA--protein transferase 1 isoform X2 [Silene latifolia]|uniref:arginyl-tRNA--protein transferase 1 isoform X2 n=1 Tax=Silene latifolia TaxID=37657 RepID=UPI003D789643
MKRNEASSSNSSGGINVGESVVVDVGRRRSSCGYCKSGARSSVSHGLWARSLTIADYQELLDRGWRRSGCYLYKPEMESTCCPSYTIRLKADKFTPSKEQNRVFRRMKRYLDGIWDGKKQELPDKSDDLQGIAHGDELPSSTKIESLVTSEPKSKEDEILDYLSKQIDLAIQSLVESGDLPSDVQYPKSSVKKVSSTKKRRIVEGPEDLLYTNNISFQLAAIAKKAKRDGSSSDLSPKNIAEELVSAVQQSMNSPDLSVKACNGHINFYSLLKETPCDEQNHQVSLSSDISSQREEKGGGMVPENLQSKKRKLEIHLNRSSFDPEEFALYRKYQTKVHNDEPDDVTESSYTRFLIDTPLIYIPPTSDNTVPPCGFGSFHQQYRLDGRLIAVGVIDILPKCLSSKYLFWDPELAFLSLGKYSALQEISWVKENQGHCPSLEYYYLGYYIHSCPKMRYKAAYNPSELLCPLRYQWVRYDFAKPLLDRARYAVLSDYANAQDGAYSLTQEPGKRLKQKQNDLSDGNSNNSDMSGNGNANDTDMSGDRDSNGTDMSGDGDSNDTDMSDDESFPETNDQATVSETETTSWAS